MVSDLIILLLGLIILVAGSEIVVEFAQKFARRLKISELVIGLTILSFGSNIPELITNLKVGFSVAGGTGTPGIAVGNILGSCFVQLTLVIGACGMISAIYIDRQVLKRDGIALMSALAAMLLAAIDGHISRQEGITLCLFYIAYLLILGKILSKTLSSHHTPHVVKKILNFLHVHPIHETDVAEMLDEHVPQETKSPRMFIRDIAAIAGGMAIVVLGANLVVDHGQNMARTLQVSSVLIGVFLGLGTSLPDLAIGINAVRKGASSLGVGSLIGGNIINTTFVIGAGAMVSGFDIEPKVLFFEFPFLVVVSIITLLMLRDHDDLDRSEAITLILLYLLFIFFNIFLFTPIRGTLLATGVYTAS
ncbi:MAG TPA: calcium/sodium antiporter [bacterium]|nr:calcium/sodium antiporter [bacterium]